MSGFDIAFRSQQHAGEQELRFREQGASEGFRATQLSLQHAGFIAGLQQQAWQQERQANELKIREMLATDDLKRSKLQLQMDQQNLERGELEIELIRKQMEDEPNDLEQQLQMEFAQSFIRDPWRAAQAGYVFDPDEPMRFREAESEQELQEYIEHLQRSTPQSGTSFNQRAYLQAADALMRRSLMQPEDIDKALKDLAEEYGVSEQLYGDRAVDKPSVVSRAQNQLVERIFNHPEFTGDPIWSYLAGNDQYADKLAPALLMAWEEVQAAAPKVSKRRGVHAPDQGQVISELLRSLIADRSAFESLMSYVGVPPEDQAALRENWLQRR